MRAKDTREKARNARVMRVVEDKAGLVQLVSCGLFADLDDIAEMSVIEETFSTGPKIT